MRRWMTEKKPKLSVRKNGVMAKREAMRRQKNAIGEGVKAIRANIETQVRENKSAVRTFGSGVKALQGEMRKAGKAIAEGAKAIAEGAKAMRANTEIQVRDNKAYVKDFYFG